MLVVALHFHFWSSFCCCIFICRFSSFPFHGLSPGFYTHFILSAQPIAEWFATPSFPTILISSYRERYGFEWAFFTHTLFYQHFWLIPRLLRLPWEPAVLPWRTFLACRASYWSSIHRPGPSVCLIHSNPQSSYSERFVFNFCHILAWITCGEKFSL